MAELAATNLSAVGRKYGVSGNAVRKWVGWYEAERERATRSDGVSAGAPSGERTGEPRGDRPGEAA